MDEPFELPADYSPDEDAVIDLDEDLADRGAFDEGQ